MNSRALIKMRIKVTWVITGTRHGAIIEAASEGDARRLFHQHFHGETIIYVKCTNMPIWVY